jgi:hypothetical protein
VSKRLLWFGKLRNRLSKPVAEPVEAPVSRSAATVRSLGTHRQASPFDRLSDRVSKRDFRLRACLASFANLFSLIRRKNRKGREGRTEKKLYTLLFPLRSLRPLRLSNLHLYITERYRCYTGSKKARRPTAASFHLELGYLFNQYVDVFPI